MWVLTSQSRFAPAGSGACQDLPLGVLLVALIALMSSEASHLVCWLWGLLGVTGASQCQMLPVIGSGVLIRSLRAMHGW